MTEEDFKILSLFEKHKGFSSNMFDGDDWREFDAFMAGYKIEKDEK